MWNLLCLNFVKNIIKDLCMELTSKDESLGPTTSKVVKLFYCCALTNAFNATLQNSSTNFAFGFVFAFILVIIIVCVVIKFQNTDFTIHYYVLYLT